MPPLSLCRVKSEDVVSPNPMRTKTYVLKQENPEHYIHVQPKNETINCVSSSPYANSIKGWDTKTENNWPKRKLNDPITGHRRPQFPLAIRVHKYLMSKDPHTLSSKELSSLTWAESVIVHRFLKRAKETAIKDELPVKVMNPFAKNVLISKEVKSDPIVPNSLQLEIIDCGSLDRKYNFERGKLIEKAFNKAVCDHILSKSLIPTPKFGLTTWRNGVLVLDCKDTNSFNFARVAVHKMVPWPYAKLRAIPLGNDTLTYIGRFHAPNIDIKTIDVIKILQSQNPTINMKNWKVFEERTFHPGFKTYYLAISQPPPTFVQNNYLKILFGASELALELIKKESNS